VERRFHIPYHDETSEISWCDSSLRTWLNEVFIEEAFTEEEQSRILPTALPNYPNPDHGTEGCEDTTDRVFLLDVQEASKYFPTADSRMAFPTEAVRGKGIISVHDNCLWRLRTAGRTRAHAVIVLTTGEYDYCGLNVNYSLACIRPAMWIKKAD